MNLMLPTARRKDGEKQPCIKIWKFDLRIPFGEVIVWFQPTEHCGL